LQHGQGQVDIMSTLEGNMILWKPAWRHSRDRMRRLSIPLTI
jgi:hypothetical protein